MGRRPGVERFDVVAHVATMLAEFRAATVAAHLLKRATGEADIGSGLLGRQKRTLEAEPREPLDGLCRVAVHVRVIVVHASSLLFRGRNGGRHYAPDVQLA